MLSYSFLPKDKVSVITYKLTNSTNKACTIGAAQLSRCCVVKISSVIFRCLILYNWWQGGYSSFIYFFFFFLKYLIKRQQFRIILFITADLISTQGFRETRWDMLSPISTPASQKVSCVWTAARTLNDINKRNTYPQLCQMKEKKQVALQLSLSWITMAGHFLQSSSRLTNI